MTDRRPGRDPSTEHLSDHGLLALTARGDREAFARLYDMYGGAAYALALRIVRDLELDTDIDPSQGRRHCAPRAEAPGRGARRGPRERRPRACRRAAGLAERCP